MRPASPALAVPAAGPRERLLEGLAAGIRARGYRGTTIADVVREARTSRRTFYECFPDKETCFLELVERAGDVLLAEVERSADPRAAWAARIDSAIDAYIGALAADPALTVSVARELPALGERGVAVQRHGIERFARLCARLSAAEARRHPGIAPVSEDTALMLTGGLHEMVVHAAERGEDVGRLGPVARAVFRAVLAGTDG